MKIKISILLLLVTLFSFAQNQTAIDSLNHVLKTALNEDKAGILNDLSKAYLTISQKKASECANKALIYAQKTDNHLEEIYALFNISIIFQNQNKYCEALTYYQLSLRICKKYNYYDEIAEIYSKTSQMYWNLSDYDKALDYCLKSLTTYENLYSEKNKIEYKKSISNILYNIGLIYSEIDAYDKALEYCVKSLDISMEIHAADQESKSKRNIANCLSSIGIIYRNSDCNEKALSYYQKSLKMFKELDYKNGIAGVLNNIGMVYTNMEDYEKALKYFSESLEITMESGNKQNISNTITNIGGAYLNKGDYDMALQNLEQSLKLAKEVGDREIILENYQFLSELFHAKDDIKNAFEYYKLYSGVKDSIYNLESINKIAETQTKYKITKKEQEIQLQDAKLKSQENLLIFIVMISLIILISSIIFFIQKLKQKKANKELVRKNLEIVESGKELLNTKSELEKAILVLKEKNIPIKSSKVLEKTSTFRLPETHKQKLLDEIINLFANEKVFLDNDMNIDKLSKQLNTNRTYISQVINDSFKKSFSDFLNEYRVKEARKLLSNPDYKHLSIEGIASDVGFTTPTTFYRCFKKFTGVTPTFYIKTLKPGSDI